MLGHIRNSAAHLSRQTCFADNGTYQAAYAAVEPRTLRKMRRHSTPSPAATHSSTSVTQNVHRATRRGIFRCCASGAKVDAHLHVWAPANQADIYPFTGALIGSSTSKEPPLPGHVEVLQEQMKIAGVSGALIVQPGNHLYDHSYVISVLRKHPQQFAGCLLADPRPEGGRTAELARLIKEEGFRAVRFNPYLWPEGELMTNQLGRELYCLAGDLGAPVSHMPFKGFLRHVDEIETLCKEYPHTKCVIDHFGFCGAGKLEGEEWQRLLGLAKYPQVYVKASAAFRVSSQPYPYLDVWPSFVQLVDTFGANRVMWGTDFPWVMEKCGYDGAWKLLDEWEREAGGRVLQPEEREWVLGGTLIELFPGIWNNANA